MTTWNEIEELWTDTKLRLRIRLRNQLGFNLKPCQPADSAGASDSPGVG